MFDGDYVNNALSVYAPTRRDPVGTFTAVPSTGTIGVSTPVTLTWTNEFGVSFSIDQGVGAVTQNGSTVVPGLLASRTWTITITKLNGTTVQRQATYTAS